MVSEGSPAPNFRLVSHDGSVVELSELRGRYVVLYFYPKAFTSGCTLETQEFSRLWNEFEKMNVVVLGISTDSQETQRRFAEKYGVRFRLLSDKEGNVAKAYGILRPTGTAERVTFIVDPEGRIVKIIRNVRPDEHPRIAMDYLRQLISS
jgi:peroxiredoxin Q/BCP